MLVATVAVVLLSLLLLAPEAVAIVPLTAITPVARVELRWTGPAAELALLLPLAPVLFPAAAQKGVLLVLMTVGRGPVPVNACRICLEE